MARSSPGPVWILLILAAFGTTPGAAAEPPSRGFDVEHYDAEVRPDLDARSVSGRVAIRLRATEAVRMATFNRGVLIVDRVTAAGVPLRFDLPDRQVVVHLAAPTRAGESLTIDVAYHGAPSNGLVFAPDRAQVYTIFTTRQWLVCVDEPDDKATLDRRLLLPRRLVAVASGEPVERSAAVDDTDTTVHHWRQAQPVATFTMAFAAGRFTEVTGTRGSTTFRFLGDGFTSEELTRAFAATADMVAFFERRAGIPYPSSAYTQALVADTAGQEAAGFSMLSEAYGRRLLGDPSALLPSAHELAHQWWAVSVTCWIGGISG